jgi:uncharacterized membrane protein YeaQ/YmgE (transglycosylase-associated protein family)
MSIAVFVSWVLVGVLAGALAGYAMKSGGYGLRWDTILGVAGSIVGNWIFLSLGVFPQAEMATTAVVAFVGATVSIVAQRKAWPTIV